MLNPNDYKIEYNEIENALKVYKHGKLILKLFKEFLIDKILYNFLTRTNENES